jgi:predicted dehydrogenase
VFEEGDASWRLEWSDFVRGVVEGTPMLGDAEDGLRAMAMLDALYRSARTGAPEPVQAA